MSTIKLNDGKSIPALGWGNGTGGIERSGQKAIDLGAAALKAGILHIDTAQIYGTEAETQGAIDKAGMKRGDVWVTSKISGQCTTDEKSIRANVQGSLDKLKSPPDLLLIHAPTVPEKGKIGEFWTILEGLVNDGTLKGTSLGVSNFRPQDLNDVLKVAKIKPVVNQMEFHPYLLTHTQPVMDIHKQHNIVTQAYGPLSPVLRHPGGPLKPVLEKIAKRLGTDEANVLLKWTVQMGVVAITTSSNEGRIQKMASIDKLDNLTDEEMAEIDKVGRGIHFRSYAGHMSTDFPSPDLPDGK